MFVRKISKVSDLAEISHFWVNDSAFCLAPRWALQQSYNLTSRWLEKYADWIWAKRAARTLHFFCYLVQFILPYTHSRRSIEILLFWAYKIHDTNRWQNIDPTPQKYMLSGAASQNLSKKKWKWKKVRGGSYFRLYTLTFSCLYKVRLKKSAVLLGQFLAYIHKI